MRRPVWHRVLVALWGLWFTAALIEPAGLFACAVHSSHAAHGGMGDAAAHAGHAMGGGTAEDMASAGADHALHVASVIPVTGHAKSQPHPVCTCLGECCSGVPVAPPTSQVQLVQELPARRGEPGAAVIERAATIRAFALPFANGPPATGVL